MASNAGGQTHRGDALARPGSGAGAGREAGRSFDERCAGGRGVQAASTARVMGPPPWWTRSDRGRRPRRPGGAASLTWRGRTRRPADGPGWRRHPTWPVGLAVRRAAAAPRSAARPWVGASATAAGRRGRRGHAIRVACVTPARVGQDERRARVGDDGGRPLVRSGRVQRQERRARLEHDHADVGGDGYRTAARPVRPARHRAAAGSEPAGWPADRARRTSATHRTRPRAKEPGARKRSQSPRTACSAACRAATGRRSGRLRSWSRHPANRSRAPSTSSTSSP